MPRQKKHPTNNTAANLRPIAKSLVKQALRAYDAAKEAFTEAGGKLEDLLKEARTEMKDGKPPKPAKKKPRSRSHT